MASDRLLEIRNTTFAELFGNSRRYVVPPFQRDYAWKRENWEDLWQDILTVHQTQSLHFMGAIVTQPSSNTAAAGTTQVTADNGLVFLSKTSTIIDGQQRLATLSIIAIAIISKIQQLAESGIDTEENRERQDILRRTYLGGRAPGSLK